MAANNPWLHRALRFPPFPSPPSDLVIALFALFTRHCEITFFSDIFLLHAHQATNVLHQLRDKRVNGKFDFEETLIVIPSIYCRYYDRRRIGARSSFVTLSYFIFFISILSFPSCGASNAIVIIMIFKNDDRITFCIFMPNLLKSTAEFRVKVTFITSIL